MKKQIWKFPLKIDSSQKVLIPVGAEILSFQNQNETPCIWALVNPDGNREERLFEIVGTGTSINYGMGTNRQYIGTCQILNGQFVYHLFERF